jgi:hypothetical protein
MVYGLPVYVFNGHVNGIVRGRITGEVVDPQSTFIPMVDRTAYYPIQRSR